MNQILYNNNTNNKKISRITSIKKIKSLKFKIIFYISLLACSILLVLYFSSKYKIDKNEKLSKSLLNNYDIKTLYSNSNEYSGSRLYPQLDINSDPFVIGLIEIDKINLVYPILSNSTEELLKISPCRFYGPMPNEIGNLCIAGHNYVDNKLFSKINLLNNNDIIKIYDLSGNSLDYIIYDKYEVEINNISCINQDTNGFKEVTLVTCNNVKGTRVILKAKENR